MPRHPFPSLLLVSERTVARWAALCLFPALLPAAEPSLDVFRRDVQPILEKYCYDCHGNGLDKGGVNFEIDTVEGLQDHKLWERALRNVRSGIMPPAEELPLPTAEAEKLIHWIKRDAFQLDPAKPDPGRVTVRRLNRVEYRNTIRDLTGVDYETQKEFPADDTGHGFDNIADVLTISPMLLEKYLDAAQNIIGKAVVTKPKTVVEAQLLGKQFATLKIDTRIPAAANPTPPADAALGLPPTPAANPNPAANAPAESRAAAPAPQAAPAVAANTGAPAAPAAAPGVPPGRGKAFPGRGQGRGGGRGRGGPPPVTRPEPTIEGDTLILSYYTPATVGTRHRIERAGKYQLAIDLTAHETYADDLFDLNKCRVVVALNGEKLVDEEFVREGYSKKFEYVVERDLTPDDYEFTVEIQPIAPETPQYRRLRIRLNAITVRGPMAPEHWVKTPGYDKYFPRDVPASAAERRTYAREILQGFASRAFRRPVDAQTLDRLSELAERVYSQPTHTFESGVAQAMVAVLASPSFIFREDHTLPLKAGETYPFVDEYSLASRLSYFLWSSMPDEELLKLAAAGQLRANLPAQLKRMLRDPRSGELVRNFAGQWLQARDIATVPITAEEVYLRDHPDPAYEAARETLRRVQAIPAGERTAEDVAALQAARQASFAFTRQPKPDLTPALRAAMLKETEMTFGYVLKEDRSLLELLHSDYTFLNEELAKHYGIEGVTGEELRKVTLPPDSPRGGVLTQGTVLAVTSNPTRTSPVKRGVFILEAILGTPPAPPPPNIPSLEEAASAEELRTMSLRETLALHAKNPACASCHSRMDPLGLAFENFNAMGMWRTMDANQPVLPAGKLITGETFSDVRELKRILATSRRNDFYHSIAEKLLIYALGRGLEYYDVATLDHLAELLEKSGGRPSALLEGIVNSAPFQQRRPTPASLAGDASSAPERLSQTHP